MIEFWSAWNLSPNTPNTNVAVAPATPFAIPNTDDAKPYELDGQILLIIDIVFPVQTSAKIVIK